MMIIAAVCWGIWILRNKVTFDKHIARTPLEAVFTVCSFLMYFPGLLKGIDKESVQAGVQKMVRVAASLADRSALRGEAYAGQWCGSLNLFWPVVLEVYDLTGV